MLKDAIAQMKQNPEKMSQLIRENKALDGVSQAQKQAMYDIFNVPQQPKVQVRGMWWLAY